MLPHRRSSPQFIEQLESRFLCSASTIRTLPAANPQPAAAASTAHQLLPDLRPWANKRRDYIYGWNLDRAEQPGHLLLRLTTAIANTGAGPLELRGGSHTTNGQNVYQRIYNHDGTYSDRLAGTFTYHCTIHPGMVGTITVQ